MRYVLILILLPGVISAAEFYKCVSPDGNTVYADAPCGPNAEPIESRTGNAAPDAHAQRAEARENLRDTQRYINLRRVDREIRESQRVIGVYRGRMRAEIAALRRSQRFSTNNLAGATRDVSLAQEMTAITQKYQALIRVEQAELDHWFQVRERVVGG